MTCDRTYGEGLYDDCFFGGAEPESGCADCTSPDPCAQQAPDTSGPADRIVVVAPPDGGEC